MKITNTERVVLKAVMAAVDHNWSYHQHRTGGDCPNCLMVTKSVIRVAARRRAR